MLKTILFLLLFQQVETRTYWHVTIEQMPTNKHTHVQTTGKVSYVMHEKDGDTHIKLTSVKNPSKFIVAECIPKLPCKIPVLGTIITVSGISRFDGEHKWFEIHPVEFINGNK